MFEFRTLLIAIPTLPLLAAIFTALLGPRILREKCHWLTVIAIAGSFVCSSTLLMKVQSALNAQGEVLRFEYVEESLWTWVAVEGATSEVAEGTDGSFQIDVALRADSLTAIMLCMVTFISTLVAIYSIGYMHGDRSYWRFFAYISVFVFSMNMLVLVSNFVLLFVFWEAVGACSYLLIGFWYTKPEAAAAGKKAFLVNRVGDFGFALALFLIWTTYGSLNYHDTHAVDGTVAQIGVLGEARLSGQADFVGGGTALAICLLLMLGACGKSAQFPLHVWLPDAMEGPTPVSALIHAATMVTAGVYMVARCTPLFMVSPDAQLAVACVGGLTALMAGIIAMTQTDLKRVLAYSTISQLGYMFLALGTGTLAGIAAAMFHLFTHAFFKALLFLGAGSVMHGMGNVIDMRRFGGLRKIMPITCVTFLIGCIALAGVPPLSGFWSKDAILGAVHDRMHDAEHALRVGRLTLPPGNAVADLETAFSGERSFPGSAWECTAAGAPPLHEQAEPAIQWVPRREPGNQNPLRRCPPGGSSLSEGRAGGVEKARRSTLHVAIARPARSSRPSQREGEIQVASCVDTKAQGNGKFQNDNVAVGSRLKADSGESRFVTLVESPNLAQTHGDNHVSSVYASMSSDKVEFHRQAYKWLYWMGIATALLTAFYTFRAFFMTFFGEEIIPEQAQGHAHESPRSMWVPLAILSVFALFVGLVMHYQGHPDGFGSLLMSTPSLAYETAMATRLPGEFHMSVAATSMLVALAGVGLAAFLYLGDRRELPWLTYLWDFGWLRPAAELKWLAKVGKWPVLVSVQNFANQIGVGWLTKAIGLLLLVLVGVLLSPFLVGYYLSPYKLSQRKFYFDEIYAAFVVKPLCFLAVAVSAIDRLLIDGVVNLIGKLPVSFGGSLRKLQNGLVPFYGLAMVLGALALFAVRVFWTGS